MRISKAFQEGFLIQKLREGDPNAFNLIFSEYYQGLVIHAIKYLGDKNNAEDAVQTVFINLWNIRRNFQISVRLGTYLQQAVRNKCLDHLKHNKIVINHASESMKKMVNLHSSGEDTILYRELMERLEELIENLPAKNREIFVLSRYEGKKYTEIAQQLGISIKTVESYIGKSIKILREQLKNDRLI
ncbi:MAG: RNA polymerase sigma-70 factor [Bacteroidota bacterium]